MKVTNREASTNILIAPFPAMVSIERICSDFQERLFRERKTDEKSERKREGERENSTFCRQRLDQTCTSSLVFSPSNTVLQHQTPAYLLLLWSYHLLQSKQTVYTLYYRSLLFLPVYSSSSSGARCSLRFVTASLFLKRLTLTAMSLRDIATTSFTINPTMTRNGSDCHGPPFKYQRTSASATSFLEEQERIRRRMMMMDDDQWSSSSDVSIVSERSSSNDRCGPASPSMDERRRHHHIKSSPRTSPSVPSPRPSPPSASSPPTSVQLNSNNTNSNRVPQLSFGVSRFLNKPDNDEGKDDHDEDGEDNSKPSNDTQRSPSREQQQMQQAAANHRIMDQLAAAAAAAAGGVRHPGSQLGGHMNNHMQHPHHPFGHPGLPGWPGHRHVGPPFGIPGHPGPFGLPQPPMPWFGFPRKFVSNIFQHITLTVPMITKNIISVELISSHLRNVVDTIISIP